MRIAEDYEKQRIRFATICGLTAPPCALVAYMVGSAVHWDGQGAVLTLPFVAWFWFGSIMAILHSLVLLIFARSRLTGLTKNCLVAVLVLNLLIYALGIVLYLNRPVGQRRRSETGKQVTIFGSDALGNRTTLAYDNVGRVATVMNARGSISTHTYNARSDLLSVTDALAGVSEFFYDALGRRTATKTPLLFLATTVYDAAGQVLATIDLVARRKDLPSLFTEDQLSLVRIVLSKWTRTCAHDASGIRASKALAALGPKDRGVVRDKCRQGIL